MTDKYQMKGGYLLRDLNKTLGYPLTDSKYCDLNEKDSTYSKIVKNVDIWDFNLKNDQNKNILRQHVSLKIKNGTNIDNSP